MTTTTRSIKNIARFLIHDSAKSNWRRWMEEQAERERKHMELMRSMERATYGAAESGGDPPPLRVQCRMVTAEELKHERR